MSRSVELVKATASILVSRFLTILISIAFMAYFARVFSKDQMAIYAILTMLTSWNYLLGGLGMMTLAQKDISYLQVKDKHAYVKKLITSVIIYRAIAMLLISVLWYVICPYLTEKTFGNKEHLDLVYYVIVIAYVTSMFQGLLGIHVAVQKFHSRALINVVIFFIQRALCVSLFLYFGQKGFFTGFLIASLLGVLWALYDLRSYLTTKLISFWSLLSESKGYMGLGLLEGTISNIDRPVIIFFLGADALASYHIAKILYENLYMAMQAVIVPIGVKFGEVKAESEESIRLYFKRSMIIIGHLFIPAGACVILLGGIVVELYAGKNYESAKPVMACFGLTLIGSAIWYTCRAAGLRLLRARQLIYQYLLSTIVTLICFCIFLPSLGAVGIPISMALGYFVGIYPIVKELKKDYGISLPGKSLMNSSFCSLLFLTAIILVTLITNKAILFTAILLYVTVVYIVWTHVCGPREFSNILVRIYSKVPLLNIITKSIFVKGKGHGDSNSDSL